MVVNRETDCGISGLENLDSVPDEVTLTEKALKVRSITLRASYSEPEVVKKNDAVTTSKVSSEPLAMFQLKYRSIRTLTSHQPYALTVLYS